MGNWVVTARGGWRTLGDCGAAPSTQSWRGGSAVEQHVLGDPQREGTQCCCGAAARHVVD